MATANISAIRLCNQQISQPEFTGPSELVKWLGAVQAQDFGAAKWALGLRMPGVADADIEKEFNNGRILRTHIMRPTWHFVTPADIRWITELTALRVKAQCAHMNRKMELDEATFKRTNKIIISALNGNKHLTRPELGDILQTVGIAVDGLRLIYIILRAELDAIICSGPRRGKQFTYALLDERVPGSKPLMKDEALAELAKRYFFSHGPATLQDFIWWSGLATGDAKAGLEMIKPKLRPEITRSHTYWYADTGHTAKTKIALTYLLPIFDEYIIAYKDRSAVIDSGKFDKVSARGSVIFNNTVITEGKVAGIWKRTIRKDKVIIEPITFMKTTKAQKKSIEEAADSYGAFLGLAAELKWQ